MTSILTNYRSKCQGNEFLSGEVRTYRDLTDSSHLKFVCKPFQKLEKPILVIQGLLLIFAVLLRKNAELI